MNVSGTTAVQKQQGQKAAEADGYSIDDSQNSDDVLL